MEKICNLLSGVSKDILSKFCLQRVFCTKDNDLMGAEFCITDDEGRDFKFALSYRTLLNCKEISDVFGSEIKYFNKLVSNWVSYTTGGILRCVPEISVLEKRESNLDWSLEPSDKKWGYLFIKGGKYNQKDVVFFDLFDNVMDALEIALRD